MGRIKKHESALFFAGMLTSIPSLFSLAEDQMTGRFGPVLLESPPLPFQETNYYEKESGSPLSRKFFAFSEPFDPARLPDAKHFTNGLEDEVAGKEGLSRPLNIDPGYLTLAKVVLASTKNHWHRLFLGQGIYGELTLAYKGGIFKPMPWTYRDYLREDYKAFFSQVREKLYARFLASRK